MKRFIPVLLMLVSFFACTPIEERINPHASVGAAEVYDYPDIDIPPLRGEDPLTKEELVVRAYELGEGDFSEFEWKMTSDFELWSAVTAGENTLIVGYKPADAGDTWAELGDINLSSTRWQQARDYTIGFVLQELNKQFPDQLFTEEDLEIAEPGSIPVLYLRVPSYEAVAKLRKLATVRYVEPDGFDVGGFILESAGITTPEPILEEVDLEEGSLGGTGSGGTQNGNAFLGCGGHEPYNPNPRLLSPFNSTHPNSMVSWHLKAAKIDQAWANSQGNDVTIGLLDTGISFDQDLLSSPAFTFGPSNGRSFLSTNTYNGPYGNQNDSHDRCGHGTHRAGLLVGPVNNDGAITGAAFKANLHSVRVSNSVFIMSRNTRNAFVAGLNQLANNPKVKVINICMGRLTHSRVVKDAVDFAINTKHKLLVCSAGNDLSNSIRQILQSGIFQNYGLNLILNSLGNLPVNVYPAKYSNTVAVTGVKYRPNSDPNGQRLKIANDNPIAHLQQGPFVDFAAYIKHVETGNEDNWAFGMQLEDPEPRRAVGSSTATPVVAGIAALVWAANPTLTSSQVYDILKCSASLSTNKSNEVGYGVIDAEEAVFIAINFNATNLSVGINGANIIRKNGVYKWKSAVAGLPGNLSYKWYWTENGNTTLVGTGPDYLRNISVGNGKRFIDLKLEVSRSCGAPIVETTKVTIF